jgi:hypothetical protein
MDALVQLFPGGDHLEMPADALVSVQTVWEPKPSRIISDGSLCICKVDSIMGGVPLPFAMGAVAGCDGAGEDDTIVVQWYVPPRSFVVNSKGGKKKTIPDLFGKWQPFSNLSLDESSHIRLPPVLVHRGESPLLSKHTSHGPLNPM